MDAESAKAHQAWGSLQMSALLQCHGSLLWLPACYVARQEISQSLRLQRGNAPGQMVSGVQQHGITAAEEMPRDATHSNDEKTFPVRVNIFRMNWTTSIHQYMVPYMYEFS